MSSQEPSDAEIRSMLKTAAKESDLNSGAVEQALHAQMMRERARRSANRGQIYYLIAALGLVVLMYIGYMMFHQALNIG